MAASTVSSEEATCANPPPDVPDYELLHKIGHGG